jgi:hypothetical protein
MQDTTMWLFQELKPKPGVQQMSYDLLAGMLQLASKNKVKHTCTYPAYLVFPYMQSCCSSVMP